MQKINQLIVAIILVAGIFSGASASEPTLTGTHLLDSMGRNLPALQKKQVRRTRNNFQIGDLHNFKTFNFASKKWEETPARLVKAGENICLYLEEGQTVEEAILDGLIKEFDSVIYPTTARYFGNEARPGIDGENRLTVLLMDIRDDAETSGFTPAAILTAPTAICLQKSRLTQICRATAVRCSMPISSLQTSPAKNFMPRLLTNCSI